MVRKLFIAILCFFILSSILFSVAAQEINIEARKIEYNLPYPGDILPDHPLYFLKNLRDNTLEFATRNYIKKAELDLKLSDKKASTAVSLSKKGKWRLAGTLMLKSENQALRIPRLLVQSKKEGAAPLQNFILTLRLSNEKHQEIIEALLKDAPQGERKDLEEAFLQNQKVKRALASL